MAALTIAAEGGKADIVKPMRGMGPGVFEIALPFRGDAFRVVYAVQIADAIWVIHAFQKKATQGIKTPQREVDLVRYRLTRLKEMLRRLTSHASAMRILGGSRSTGSCRSSTGWGRGLR